MYGSDVHVRVTTAICGARSGSPQLSRFNSECDMEKKIAQGCGQETIQYEVKPSVLFSLRACQSAIFFILHKRGSALTGLKCFLVVFVRVS